MKPNYVSWFNNNPKSIFPCWHVCISEDSVDWKVVYIGTIENAEVILDAYIKIGCAFVNKE